MNVQQLNQHPLNQAAARRLGQLGAGLNEKFLHLLELAVVAAGNEDGDTTDESIFLAGFLYKDQEVVWGKLVDELDYEPEDVIIQARDKLPIRPDDIQYLIVPDDGHILELVKHLRILYSSDDSTLVTTAIMTIDCITEDV